MEKTEKLYHIQLSEKELQGARYAIIAGDPGRIPKIAACFENPQQLAFNREYNSWLADCAGEKVVLMSHGIGGPSTACVPLFG